MYTVRVRDHFMIAHSFRGEVFGPAQKLHGATFVVDVEFRSTALDANGIVVDIGLATDTVHKILAGLNFRNLDEEPSFKGQNTTTEVLARTVFDRVAAAIGTGELGAGGRSIESMRVTLNESHVASASYEGRL
jgi:6-pyruvoyltetrahydropterin/6-carboxytetrahydropterin synthase